jgi:hypothetical protein
MLDPAYAVLLFMTTIGCPFLLHWTWQREQRKRRELVALLGR